jgi:hypothetical protein
MLDGAQRTLLYEETTIITLPNSKEVVLNFVCNEDTFSVSQIQKTPFLSMRLV